MENQKDDKLVEVFINGKSYSVDKNDDISYEKIVTLAFGECKNDPNVIYTILYYKGNSDKPKGELLKGETVKIKKGMIFNVTRTDRS